VHFRIRAQPRGGLRVIPEIPDYPICQIEGQNGVGKSVAVNLLLLASGQQPYELQASTWRSLRENLGEVEITVTNLDGADSLNWVLTPATWPASPDPIGDWLGQARIDSKPTSHSEARALLRVARIAGSESLPDTLAEFIRKDALLLRRSMPHFAASVKEVAECLERLASDLFRLKKLRRKQQLFHVSAQRDSSATAARSSAASSG